MITVAILFNGKVITARSAVNKGVQENGKTCYEVDDGSVIFHDSEESAIPLAIAMLKNIKLAPHTRKKV